MSSCLNIVSCHTQDLIISSIHERMREASYYTLLNNVVHCYKWLKFHRLVQQQQSSLWLFKVWELSNHPQSTTHSPPSLLLFVTARPLVEHFVHKLFNAHNQVAILKIILNGCRQTAQSFIIHLNESKLWQTTFNLWRKSTSSLPALISSYS